MSRSPTAERRMHPRLAVSGAVRLRLPAGKRDIPARAMDLSRGGLAMQAPPDAPLRAGQRVRILERPAAWGEFLGRPDPPAGAEPPLEATILRVDRSSILTTGQITLAVRFREPLA